jgi:hypothetical protein
LVAVRDCGAAIFFPVFFVLFLVVGEGLCAVMVVVMMVVYDGGL